MNTERHSQIQTDWDVIPDSVKVAAFRAFRALNDLQVSALQEVGIPRVKKLTGSLAVIWTPDMSKEEFAEKAFLAFKLAAAEDCDIDHGRVYCYNCRRSDCDHSVPKVASQVFAGYQDTGRPQWTEFFNYILSLDDDRVDALFSETPRILARVVGRKVLIKNQLATYGRSSMTYRIIGQVVAGYLKLDQQRFALTAQIIENRQRELKLQLVVSENIRELLADLPDNNGSCFHRLFDALKEIRLKVNRLNSRWQLAKTKMERSELSNKIFGLLRHLANSIERKGRQKYRRTSHAERRLNQERPIHKAYDDIRIAGPERFFQDNVTQSIVVFGKNGRSHVFNKEGRHITSLTITSDKLEQRQKRNRYQRLPNSQIETFLTTLKGIQM